MIKKKKNKGKKIWESIPRDSQCWYAILTIQTVPKESKFKW